jgi:hypothetical protein
MSRHKLIFEIEIADKIPDGQFPHDIDFVPTTMEVEYEFTAASPASSGEPAWPDQVGLIGARMLTLAGVPVTTRTPEDIRSDQDLAEDWLHNEGYNDACEHALEDIRQWRAQGTVKRKQGEESRS